MHCESPTIAMLEAFQGEVKGVAQVLIGQTSCFYDDELGRLTLERQTLITVDGVEWLVGQWGHPGDGEEIVVFLTQSTRI